MGKDFWTFAFISTVCLAVIFLISPWLKDWMADDDYESKSQSRLMDEIGRHRDR